MKFHQLLAFFAGKAVGRKYYVVAGKRQSCETVTEACNIALMLSSPTDVTSREETLEFQNGSLFLSFFYIIT